MCCWLLGYTDHLLKLCCVSTRCIWHVQGGLVAKVMVCSMVHCSVQEERRWHQIHSSCMCHHSLSLGRSSEYEQSV